MDRPRAGRLAPQGAGRDDAWERAEDLLLSSLTADQAEMYERHGHVEVPSRVHPGRTYRLDGWRPVAVFSPGGGFEGAICLRPRESLPAPDVIVAHKLYIEGAEEEFLRTGNWLSPAWRPTAALPTIVLLLFLVGPWMVNLVRLGPPGVAAVALVAIGLVSWAVRRVLRGDGGEVRR